MSKKNMILASMTYAFGWNAAAWLKEDSQLDGATNFDHFNEMAQAAEKAKIDFLFFADSPGVAKGSDEAIGRMPNSLNRFDPVALISALAVTTKDIGLVATLSATFTEPYNVARTFASIDHLSGGRGGWNVVTTDHDETAVNYGLDNLPPREERYSRANEFVDVVTGLWNSFDEDALVLDRESGIYADMSKVHKLNHKGEHFSVQGPLNIDRSPQGRPILAQAGSSPAGIDLAGRSADVVFAIVPTKERGIELTTAIKDAAERYGRNRDDVKILAGVVINTGETSEIAEAQVKDLADRVHPSIGKAWLGEYLEADFEDLNLDEPVPLDRLPDKPVGSIGMFEAVVERIKQGLSLRELIAHYLETSTGNGITGSYLEVADHLEQWFEAGACDGYVIMNQTVPEAFRDFTDLVVPELQKRGVFRTEYEGTTLRENLGLSEAKPLAPQQQA